MEAMDSSQLRTNLAEQGRGLARIPFILMAASRSTSYDRDALVSQKQYFFARETGRDAQFHCKKSIAAARDNVPRPRDFLFADVRPRISRCFAVGLQIHCMSGSFLIVL